MRSSVYAIICLLLLGCLAEENNDKRQKDAISSLDIVRQKDARLLLVATLDGGLIAIEQETGKTLWKIKEKPIVKVPLNSSSGIPIFLPDPRDGSIYLLGDVEEPLKKLPFTIQKLVSTSPCRSTDGILYTGKKKDTWFKLDPFTGRKQQILGWDDSNTCPVDTEKSIYIGRSQYNLRIVDGKKLERKWNVTFYDYTSVPMTKEEYRNYEFMHFTSTSTGKIVTMDRRRRAFLWEEDLGSPIIGTYLLDPEGLISVPFTSLANTTISCMVNDMNSHDGIMSNSQNLKLYPTLYIGEHLHGLYALPSLVDHQTVKVVAHNKGPLLLSGPDASGDVRPYMIYPLPVYNYEVPAELKSHVISNDGDGGESDSKQQNLATVGKHLLIYLGHYNYPDTHKSDLVGGSQDVTVFKSDEYIFDDYNDNTEIINGDANRNQIDFEANKDTPDKPANHTTWIKKQYSRLKMWINQQENKGLKLSLIIMTGCVIAMFWYLQIQVREVQNLSQNGSRTSQHSSYGQNNHVTAISEELPNGLVKVGKITFHPEQLLGKGCEGTFVYRGEFDSRRVAVKRLLPECFTFADREVALLRESDAHPHVIRYYCMEQDRMFRYIALELCQATLSDYVQGKCDISPITPLEILRQATDGLCHLHSLDIVHRDIKPHNVLISVPNNKGEVRAMISDFGLCKKLQVGRVSFSRRSGVTGTDGWIAPEMLTGEERTTYAVDMFSLGCLYYYVLSNGLHPFGDSLRRQANILSGKYDLQDLKGPDWLVNTQKPLISALISSSPEIRPSCKAALAHPMFWNYDNILSFFQEVSDRVEKSEPESYVLRELENDGDHIVKIDWRWHIHEEVSSDLKKYRSYQGQSVRDLLRALRNKKHHYRELSQEAQWLLGEDSETFSNYWMSRFPLLLVHTWITMQCVADEENFKKFYDSKHRYSVKNFKDQMRAYTMQHPVCPPHNIEKSSEKNEEWEVQKKKKDISKLPRVWNASERKELELVKSGGLYRNHGSPEKIIYTNKQYNMNKSLPKRRKSKKSDEPLVWNLQDK